MIYKICLIKNRYTKPVNLKYLDWFKIFTPIEIVTEEIVTDFDVTAYRVGNAKYQGVVCGPDVLPKIREIVPEGKYNAVVFLYGNNLEGIRMSSCNIDGTQPLYPDTEFIQTWNVLDYGKTINHELFHAFFFKANKLQAGIEDPMDTYLNDNDLDVNEVINTNREIALKRLEPYWNIICKFRDILPVVTLTRVKDTGKETLGVLTYGDFSCKTLERPWKDNKPNISCIPKGEYICKYTFSPKFMKFTYQIMNVPNRSGIRIHSANFFFDLLGCISLGDSYKDFNSDGEVDLLNSRATIKKFETLLNNKDFKLIIK